MQPPIINIYLSTHTDPFFNLAVEEWLFHNFDQNSDVIFLWRNQVSIIIGRGQNPWLECNTQRMQEDGVELVRRRSGGGTVYHDLGNTNFCIISAKNVYDKKRNLRLIQGALQQLSIETKTNDRNDILYPHDNHDFKISGSAYRESKNRAFHHGTLLIDANLNQLHDYLKPQEKSIQGKGVASVRSRVMNLSDISAGLSHDVICDAIISSAQSHYTSNVKVHTLDTESLHDIPKVSSVATELKSWEWRFAKTLPFSHQLEHEFAWGNVHCTLECRKGHIDTFSLSANSLLSEVNSAITETVLGSRYHAEDILRKLNTLAENFTTDTKKITDITLWLHNNLL